MRRSRVTALHSVDLGVADLDAAATFFTDVWGLTQVAGDSDAVWLRGTGPYHHVLALHRRQRAEILRINLLANDRNGVETLHETIAAAAANPAAGISDMTAPAALDSPGGG
jgi:catechol-2,3-dioxygenase